MRFALLLVLIILFLDIYRPLSAQQYIFKNYSVNDGLVANYVHRIFQDSKGFIWIATWDGLSKYDGHQFTNYTTGNGLSNNLVNDFYESGDGKLFLATNNGGLDMVSGNKVIPKAVASTVIVNRFLKYSDDRLLVSTDTNGLQEFREGKFIKPVQPFPNYTYNNLVGLNDSLFVASSSYSLQVLDLNYKVYAVLSDSAAHFTDNMLYRDSRNRLWTGGASGLELLLPLTEHMQLKKIIPHFPFAISALQRNKINDMFEDAAGTIWIGTSGGLLKISSNGLYQLITKKEGLISDNITRIFQDKEKNIWIGTTSGLSKLVANSEIRIYKTENGLLSNNIYFTSRVKNGLVLVGGAKGVQTFNKLSGAFTPVFENDEIFSNAVENSHSVYLIKNNKLAVFDTGSLKIREQTSFDFNEADLRIYYKDKNGIFLAGNNSAFYFVTAKSKKHEIFLRHRVTSLLFDKDGYLWAGTWDDGLFRINYSVNHNTLKIISKEHYLAKIPIRSLFEDSEGNIWAGTRYNGVYRLDKNNFESRLNFDQHTGLTSNWVTNIAEDKNGNIWLGFYTGLDKLIKHDNAFRVFNFSRVNNCFAQIVSMNFDDEDLWLSTTEGLVQIIDGEIDKLPPLPVYITKIVSSDSTYAADAGNLKLDHHHDQIQFEFSSPSFINEKEIIYSYRLLGGTHAEWTEAGNQYSISYANLKAGDYKFEVRNRGLNGSWSNPASFAFSISPPFWETTLFRAFAFASITGLIYYFFRRRIKEVRREAEMKRKIAETEMMALRAQMNPHFIFNCINSIDALIQSNDKYQATVYLNKFAKLIRNILDSSKQNVVTLSKDLETLQLYIDLEKFRTENKFTAEIKAEASLLQDDYKVPPLIIQPFVENAILHGLRNRTDNQGKLSVSVVRSNGHIQFTIEDNGVGRTSSSDNNRNDKKSYGIQMSVDRVKIFNNEETASVAITDLEENGKAGGTKVRVLLNIQ